MILSIILLHASTLRPSFVGTLFAESMRRVFVTNITTLLSGLRKCAPDSSAEGETEPKMTWSPTCPAGTTRIDVKRRNANADAAAIAAFSLCMFSGGEAWPPIVRKKLEAGEGICGAWNIVVQRHCM